MKIQIITFMIFILSLMYINIYQPIEMHQSLIDNGFRINTNIMIWVYNISKFLFIVSLGLLFKKERLVSNELYPSTK